MWFEPITFTIYLPTLNLVSGWLILGFVFSIPAGYVSYRLQIISRKTSLLIGTLLIGTLFMTILGPFMWIFGTNELIRRFKLLKRLIDDGQAV